MLRGATLDSNLEPLHPELLTQIRNPPHEPVTLTPDKCLSIDLYLSISSISEQAYNKGRKGILRRYPHSGILSFYQVKARLNGITGVMLILRDMCINSCIGFTGPFIHLQRCPTCNEIQCDRINQAPRK